MSLTFTPVALGVRRATNGHWAYWSVWKAPNYYAYSQIMPNGHMCLLDTCKTLKAAEAACQRHHGARQPEVAA